MTETNTASGPVWPEKSLAQLGARVTSGSRGWAKYYSDHGDLFVRITNLRRTSTRLDLSSPRYVQVDPDDAEARRTRLRPGDILVSITADIGIIGLVHKTVPDPAYINQHIARVRLDPKLADSRYISYFLASWAPQQRFVGATDQGAKAGMNLTAVANLTAAVPPLAEQVAIADVLDAAVAQIEALERLIAKKLDIKQGLMQELLTGRSRLPGYSGEWREVRLGDVGNTYGGLTGKDKNDFGRGDGLYVTFTEVMAGPRLVGNRLEHVRIRPGERQNQVQKEDVLFNGSSETPEEVALASVVDFRPKPGTFLNSFCFGYRLENRQDIDPGYLAYFFRSAQGRMMVSALAQGATRYNIAKTKLMHLSPLLPPVDEQQAIVAVLRDAEDEIGALQRSLTSARDITTGMMQQLLTGRTRLHLGAAS
ncbi:hypothetical protein HBK87_29330 [Streptomyces sp. 2BBP-J2]|uniref:restriction endonuclease subunit S n=1 Tax=Streptomyces sp. 2BBP-J2 TaxID=2719381 RepID=UPI0014306D00|nr:restriction endonuclease subunit S [Streptomyces sp. 2BBP-J2]NIL54622.1 hypothetical protein [Streptomyces sp. 2BBP-J2]